MSLLRLPFVLVAAAAMHVAVTPPHVAAPDERIKSTTFREAYIARTTITTHVAFLQPLIYLVFNMDSPYDLPLPPCPLHLLWGAFLSRQGASSAGSATAPWIVFSPSSSRSKKTIDLLPRGPTRFVRHPSYTGTLLLTVGLFLMHGHPDSWVRASGIMDFTPFKITAIGSGCIMLAISTAQLRKICTRGQDDEKPVWRGVGSVGACGQVPDAAWYLLRQWRCYAMQCYLDVWLSYSS
ncbi:hypothetical protein BU15DRAFT_60585 [Melanogaster broomeanus]|nr:hypothetical protein BU15DRAFT_60585 [Melanogaster broomeanus]